MYKMEHHKDLRQVRTPTHGECSLEMRSESNNNQFDNATEKKKNTEHVASEYDEREIGPHVGHEKYDVLLPLPSPHGQYASYSLVVPRNSITLASKETLRSGSTYCTDIAHEPYWLNESTKGTNLYVKPKKLIHYKLKKKMWCT